MTPSVEVVRDFLSAMDRLDVDAALAHCAPDIEYQNVPFPPARGIHAFEKQMRGMARHATGFEARIHNIAADGPIVLTERTDVLEVGAFSADFWVCGTFEVQDSKIILWRDRFDYADLFVAMLRGTARAARFGVSRLAGSWRQQPET